jgi:hypothetical protein
MRNFRQREPEPGQNVARLQERNVEALTIECDEAAEARKKLRELVEHGFFLCVVPHEELPNPEPIVLDVADAYEECACARAPSETGGLGIQENGSGEVEIELTTGQEGKIRGGSRSESGKGNLAMPMVERELVIDLVELASIVRDRTTIRDFLE